jgi:hypothetical protein
VQRGAGDLSYGCGRSRQGVQQGLVTTGERGMIGEPVTLPVLRDGVDELERLIAGSGVAGRPVIGLEASGSLHRAWAAEIERRWPGSLRLFAPSETAAARALLGSRRFKTDDRDCAALVWLLRQGAGRPAEPDVNALCPALTAHTKACRTTRLISLPTTQRPPEHTSHRSPQTPRPTVAAMTYGDRRPLTADAKARAGHVR